MNKKCRDLARLAVNDTTEALAGTHRLDPRRYKNFLEVCDLFDAVRLEGRSDYCSDFIEVEINPETFRPMVRLGVISMVAYSLTSPIYRLLAKSLAFAFCHSSEDQVVLEVLYPSLWTAQSLD